jgi:3-dehydroquinate synthase II
MKQQIFAKAIPFDKSFVTLALESGVDGIIVDSEQVEAVNSLGRTTAIPINDFYTTHLTTKEDEEQTALYLNEGHSVFLYSGWEIIPVENLLAQNKGMLGLEVTSLEEARLGSTIFEKGANFLVIPPEGISELKSIVQEMKLSEGHLELETAQITKILPVGLGHRVCVDTCSILRSGQGLLVGNSSSFSFLVNAETEPNPYVAARPFRINAGAVHAYVLGPSDSTSYLEEIRAGQEVLVVDSQGNSSIVTVGRVKVEIRPMLLITAKTQTQTGQIFLQNAETIRLVTQDGTPISVVSLQEGDTIVCRTDQAGRHFGMRIKEHIEEK